MTEKAVHPYSATTLEHWTSWHPAKRNAAEVSTAYCFGVLASVVVALSAHVCVCVGECVCVRVCVCVCVSMCVCV